MRSPGRSTVASTSVEYPSIRRRSDGVLVLIYPEPQGELTSRSMFNHCANPSSIVLTYLGLKTVLPEVAPVTFPRRCRGPNERGKLTCTHAAGERVAV